MEPEIRQMLRSRADDVESAPSLPQSTIARSRRRRVFTAGAAFVTTVALIVGAVVVVDAVRREPREITYVEEPIHPKQRTVVNVGGIPQEIAIGGGVVWVEMQREVARLDPRTDRIVARMEAVGSAGGRPVRVRYYFGSRGFALGDRAVWATGTRFTESVEPDPSQTAERPTAPPDPQSAYRWSLLKFDSIANSWVAAMPASDGSITGSLPTSIVVAPGAVWVGAEGSTPGTSGAVYHFDTNSEEATKIDLDGPVTGVALVDGGVWATVDVKGKDGRSLVKIDPKTDRVVKTVVLPGVIALQGLAEEGHDLWVPVLRSASAEIVRVSATSGRIVSRIPVAGPVPSIVASSDAIWFSVQDDRNLYRIDPTLNIVDGRLPVGGVPETFAVDGTTIWVTSDPDSGGGPKTPVFVRYDL